MKQLNQYENGKIVVAIDIFENYHPVVERAKFLGDKLKACLDFVYVLPHIDTSIPYAYGVEGEIEVDSQKKLDELKEFAQVDASQIHLCHGNPKNEISAFAEKRKADLIVVGSHGRHGFDLILGSTANGVLHTAKCDVLTVRVNQSNKCMVDQNYDDILLATDLEEDNNVVVKTAQSMASSYDANLHLVNVIPNSTATAIAYYPEVEIALRDEAEKKMTTLAQDIGVDAENTHALIGIPKTVIIDQAQQAKAGLIVIGSHSRNPIAAVLLGSTANAVLHLTQQDVLVVRIAK